MSNIIIVKIGTESLQDFETSEKVSKLVDSIVQKHHEGYSILLVTSGAVGFGRGVLNCQKQVNEYKPLLAAIGWDVLMTSYRKKFYEYGVSVAGFLVTHADLEDNTDRRQSFMATIEQAWLQGIIPIVNENDPLSIEELDALNRGGDNDKNALLLAEIFSAKELILITNTNGVFADKENPNTRIQEMLSINLTTDFIITLCGGKKSTTGTGGMASKLEVAHLAGKHGIHTHICDGIHSGFFNTETNGTNIHPVKTLDL